MAGADESAYSALFGAPELLNSPGMASSAMVSPDPTAAAQTMSQTDTASAIDQHAQQHKGMFGFVPSWIKKPLSMAADTLAKPLQDVQHEYRYIHDEFERNGMGHGLLALGEVAVPAVAGGIFGGAQGAMVGGEAAGELFRLNQPEWARTEAGKSGMGSVSPGRDLAALVNYVGNGVIGNGFHERNFTNTEHDNSTLAGFGDAFFDLTFDPTMIGAKIAKAAKLAKYGVEGERATQGLYLTDKAGHAVDELGYDARLKYGPAQLARPSISDIDMPADRVLDVYNQNSRNNRFASMVDILAKKDTAQILTDHPKLFGIADQLGQATTHDEVLNVFRDALTAKNGQVLHGGLPTTALTYKPLQALGIDTGGTALKTKAKNAVLNAGSKDTGVQTLVRDESGNVIDSVANQAPNKVVRTFTGYRPWNITDDLSKMSSKDFDPASAGAAKTVNQVLRMSQNARTANALTAAYMAAKDPAARVNIYTNAVTDMFRSFGIPDDAPVITRWKSDMQQMLDSSSAGTYATDRNGQRVLFTDPVTGEASHSGIMSNQVGSFALPDFNEMRKALRDKPYESGSPLGVAGANIRRLGGNLDDWMYHAYTSRFFKRFALLSLGFAARVSAGELLPATIKYGKDVYKGALASAAMRLQPDNLSRLVGLDQEMAGKLVGKTVGHTPNPDDFVEVHRGVGDWNGLDAEGNKFKSGNHLLDYMAEDRKHFGAWWDTDPKVAEFYGKGDTSGVVISARFHKDDLVNPEDSTGLIAKRGARGEVTRIRAVVPGEGLQDFPHRNGTTILAQEGKPTRFTGTGKIKWVDTGAGVEGGRGAVAGVRAADGTDHVLPLNELDAYHDPIQEKDIRLVAKVAGIKVDPSEVGHIKAAVGKATYGVSKALIDPDYLKTAMYNVIHNDGHIVAPALAADHGENRVHNGRNSVNEALDRIAKNLPDGQHLGNDWGVFDGGEKFHSLYWQNAIHEAANDMSKGAQAYAAAKRLGKTDEEAMSAFIDMDKRHVALNPKAYSERLAGYKTVGPDEFSRARATHFDALVHGHGSDGVYHGFVADAIANGDAPSLHALENVDVYNRPLVKGRMLENVPTTPPTLERVANAGFRKVLQPTINMLAREPIFTTAVTEQYKALKPFIEDGLMTESEANWMAQQRAVPEMLPLIHNTHLRSQFAEYTRNFLPFYYAQEQAYRRYATAFLQNPLQFERARLILHGVHASGIIQQDNQGNSYIVYPFLGAGTDHLTNALQAFGLPFTGGIANQVSGNVSSLKSVVPAGLVGMNELPGVSPLTAIGLKAIQGAFPKSEPIISTVIGPIAENQSALDSLVPNAALRNIITGTAASDNSRSFQSAFLYALQNASRRSAELRTKAAAYGQGTAQYDSLMRQADELLPGPNADKGVRQKAINRLRNTTRLMFMVRAAYSATMPMSPKIDLGDIALREEVRQDIAKAGDFTLGIQNFLDKHPDATADTVFQSDSTYTGAKLSQGAQAVDWLRANQGFVSKNVLASAYLLPQDTSAKSDPQAYNLEMAMGLAKRKTPEQFVNALYAASGNAVYYPALKERDALIKQNPDQEQDIRSKFNDWKMQLGYTNPIWFADLQSLDRATTAHYALRQLQDTINSGKAPASPQLGFIKRLIQDYDQYTTAENQLRNSGQSTADLKEKWGSYLDNFAASNPAAQAVIDGVFRRLPAYERFGQGQAVA